MSSDKVTLKSRYRNYRVRDVKFADNTAVVSAAKAKELESSSAYGPNRDFWRVDGAKIPPAAEPASGNENAGGDGGDGGSDKPPKTEPVKTEPPKTGAKAGAKAGAKTDSKTGAK